MEPAAPKAVFLSYASQDADAAQRMAQALRAEGIEVWFDESALAGGEAWDASVRRQIRDCALFVAIVPANTQARKEGYFRLEWKLAGLICSEDAVCTRLSRSQVGEVVVLRGAMAAPTAGEIASASSTGAGSDAALEANANSEVE